MPIYGNSKIGNSCFIDSDALIGYPPNAELDLFKTNPDGITGCEIGNNSYTNNKWNIDRPIMDYSITMIYNEYIYLCERGTYKLFRFCPEIKLAENETKTSLFRLAKNKNTRLKKALGRGHN